MKKISDNLSSNQQFTVIFIVVYMIAHPIINIAVFRSLKPEGLICINYLLSFSFIGVLTTLQFFGKTRFLTWSGFIWAFVPFIGFETFKWIFLIDIAVPNPLPWI